MKELSRNNIDNPDIKDDTEAQNNKTKDDKLLIEKLNKEITDQNKVIIKLQNKLLDTEEKIHDIILDKASLKKQINNFELKELDIQFGKFEELKNDYNKIEHRLNVTKEQLDDARNNIEFYKKVIEDLENRGFMDYLRNRFPESFVNYKKK
jgi:chromosome segregation ATPase